TWIETGEAPDWQRLYERREPWQIGTVPTNGLFLTAGADVQKDRIEVDVWAWGRGLESWLVDHTVVEGGPEHAETWNTLGRLLNQTWPHAHGTQLGLAKLAIDTGVACRVCLGAPGRARASGSDQGRRGLQPGGTGGGPDACGRDRGWQEASPRRAAVDDFCRNLQERDLSLPALVGADR